MNAKTRKTRENSCGWLVKVMGLRMDAAMKVELEEHELDLKSFSNLMCLFEQDELTQVELGQRVGNPQYATSRVVDALEQRKLVRRRPDPTSRRAHRIVLTAKGESLRKVLPAIVQRVNNKMLAGLEGSERKNLVSLLQKALGVNTKK